jgi:hypothetical protein
MYLLFSAATASATDYEDLKAALAAEREALREVYDADPVEGLRAARETLEQGIEELLPHWEGTAWAMNGTTQVPGVGRIACGYLVSTVLRDAGLPVDRVKLAQQASENILATVVEEPGVSRYWRRPIDEVLRDSSVQGHGGDGIYVVGLDTHVGLLVVRDEEPIFCHASRTLRVVCEDATVAKALHSRYLVLGRLSDRAVEAWLTGAALPTATGPVGVPK